MKTIFVILMSFAIINPLFAQPTPTPPSLKPIEVSEKNADIFFQNGINAFNVKNYRHASDYFVWAMEMYVKLGLKEKAGKTLEWMKKNNLAMADSFVEEAKEFENQKAFDLAYARLKAALEEYTYYEEEEKIETTKKEMERIAELQAKKQEALALFGRGERALINKDYSEAKQNFENAKEIFQELDYEQGVQECDDYLLKIEKEYSPEETGITVLFILYGTILLWIIKGKHT